MKMLGLPGRDAATEQWLRELLSRLGDGDRCSTVHGYRHWQGADEPDVAYEAGLIVDQWPVLCIAQTADFTGPFAELEQLLDSTAATLVEVAGDDHI
jgi:hypothetical protein